MTAARRASCQRCGAILVSDQEYCLACGTRRVPPARSPWIAPLVAAAVVIVTAAVLLVLAYRDLRDDANREAAAPVATQSQPQDGAERDGDRSGARTTPGSSTD